MMESSLPISAVIWSLRQKMCPSSYASRAARAATWWNMFSRVSPPSAPEFS